VSLFTFESSLGFGAERMLGGVKEEFFGKQIDFLCLKSTSFLGEISKNCLHPAIFRLQIHHSQQKLTTSLKLHENRSRHFPNFPLSSP
jgi:hypothetical protein